MANAGLRRKAANGALLIFGRGCNRELTGADGERRLQHRIPPEEDDFRSPTRREMNERLGVGYDSVQRERVVEPFTLHCRVVLVQRLEGSERAVAHLRNG